MFIKSILNYFLLFRVFSFPHTEWFASYCTAALSESAVPHRKTLLHLCFVRNPIQPSGHYTYRQLNIQQFYVLPTQLIYVFCVKSKGVPRQAEVALGVLGRLMPRIFSTFGTTRVEVVSQTHRPPLSQEKSLVLIFRG